ncbi:hypothetical protein [Caenispirillum bisanense]|uniref:hypothetical protein n=1 Tax=Caenispirillum bisanense TaxID=414052 RepID=UPI0031D0612E
MSETLTGAERQRAYRQRQYMRSIDVGDDIAALIAGLRKRLGCNTTNALAAALLAFDPIYALGQAVAKRLGHDVPYDLIAQIAVQAAGVDQVADAVAAATPSESPGDGDIGAAPALVAPATKESPGDKKHKRLLARAAKLRAEVDGHVYTVRWLGYSERSYLPQFAITRDGADTGVEIWRRGRSIFWTVSPVGGYAQLGIGGAFEAAVAYAAHGTLPPRQC